MSNWERGVVGEGRKGGEQRKMFSAIKTIKKLIKEKKKDGVA